MCSKNFKSEKQKEFVKSLGKDNVGVDIDNGRYRLNISRAYSRMYYGKDQKRPNTGLSVLDSKGKIHKANADTISAKVAQIHNDFYQFSMKMHII